MLVRAVLATAHPTAQNIAGRCFRQTYSVTHDALVQVEFGAECSDVPTAPGPEIGLYETLAGSFSPAIPGRFNKGV